MNQHDVIIQDRESIENLAVLHVGVRRYFDIAFSLVLLVLFFPVMLLTAIFIKLETKGPIIYQQERIGINNRIFKIKKFRSMYDDAEADGIPRWASFNDSRITHVGNFIRKMRIDELPQLFNVLANDMSMIGPRPERPYFVQQLSNEIPCYASRHSVKPGITGLAQVCYPYGNTVKDSKRKLRFDLYYIEHQSILLDIAIILRTVKIILTRKGAL